MPLYSYQAFSKQGKRVSGTIDSQTLQSAREEVIRKQLYPVSIEQVMEASAGGSFFSSLFKKKASPKDVIFFTKQLGVLLSSGIALASALDLLIEQTEGEMRNIVVVVRDQVREGKSLADSLAMYPKVFENFYIQLIRAGEASGKLELILKRLQDYLEKNAAMKQKIASTLRGPLTQLVLIMVITAVLLLKVVPSLAETYTSMGVKLEWITRFVLSASEFLKNYIFVILGVFVGIIIAYKSWSATSFGRQTIDTIKLKLPLVSYFVKMQTITQFSRTLGMLIEAGVNLSEALTIVVNIVNNTVLTRTLLQAREKILKQGKIAEYLKQTGIFPSVAIYLINTGEQSGTLDAMLTSVAEYYERDLNDFSDSLTAKINPAMLIVMVAVVGFVIMSILMPMVGMIEQSMSSMSV
ncbi:MAG: General secretion pathway protein F [candidate division TM6 bacterium GW2011_GWE2_41_16]|nr:MAG: General secretion pathway protein F [candidate division TM6 bacterium GW2011_GWE2_41_16]